MHQKLKNPRVKYGAARLARWFLAGCGRRRREVGHPPVGTPSSKHQGHVRCAVAVVPWVKMVLPRTPERKARARNSFPAEIGNLGIPRASSCVTFFLVVQSADPRAAASVGCLGL